MEEQQVLNEVEDLFSLRYSGIVIEIHQALQDECRGFNLYEKGHPWDLGEFIKENSSALHNIYSQVNANANSDEALYDEINDYC